MTRRRRVVVGNVQDRSPHMGFVLKGSPIWVLQLKGWFKSKTSIQEYRNEIQNSYWTCAWIIWCMFPGQCEESRINHLTPLLVVTVPYACWFFVDILRTSLCDIWERYILKGQIAFEGHWRLPSLNTGGEGEWGVRVQDPSKFRHLLLLIGRKKSRLLAGTFYIGPWCDFFTTFFFG